jgi:hypothetical protein
MVSDYYPDWISGPAICQMEGCDFGYDRGSCRRCGKRLRCSCGRFIRADRCDQCPCLAGITEEP